MQTKKDLFYEDICNITYNTHYKKNENLINYIKKEIKELALQGIKQYKVKEAYSSTKHEMLTFILCYFKKIGFSTHYVTDRSSDTDYLMIEWTYLNNKEF